MFKYLLIKLRLTDPFKNDIEFCKYCQVIRENYSLSQTKYKYYVVSVLYGDEVFKKKLSRYIVSKILDDSNRMNYFYIAKDDTEFLNLLGGTTVVNSYIIL